MKYHLFNITYTSYTEFLKLCPVGDLYMLLLLVKNNFYKTQNCEMDLTELSVPV